MTPAAHARAIHARFPSLGPSEIARRVAKRLGITYTRQQASKALRSDPARLGRPLGDHVTVRVKVPRSSVPGRVVVDVGADGRAMVVTPSA
jgi:hypothetical protein